MTNLFIWADLSTIDLAEAKRFYANCFSWTFKTIGEGYVTCETGQNSAAGLYVMPDKFQRIGMPSFWMSYIRVSDIYQTVQIAKQYGARVELEPQSGPGGGLIALIRDPAGAGFTCYEGNNFGGKDESGTEGCMVWNELHVSDLAKVVAFYSNVFGWIITPSEQDDRFDIHASTGELVAGIRLCANEIKGDKEYWGVYFSVANLQEASKLINRAGGEVIAVQSSANESSVLAYDSQGAAFFLVEGMTSKISITL